MTSRAVVLCADDYAMSEGVSWGIVQLAEIGRISATGAMTNMPGWLDQAGALTPLAGRIGTGLHLNLTYGAPLGRMPDFAPAGRFPGLGPVIRAALAGGLPLGEIAAETGRQLDRFAAATGREPDFVDGHQHVHALPGIRGVLLRELATRGDARPWLRDPSDRPGSILKRGDAIGKASIVGTLATGFAAGARRAGFPTNRGFSGFTDFAVGRDLDHDFARFLRAPGPRPVVMCHPGRPDAGETLDGVVEARRREYAYLASDAFAALLERHAIRLSVRPEA